MVSFFDVGIFFLYFIILFTIGIRAARKKKPGSAESFFLTNRTLPWYAIGFSFIAAGISSAQLLGIIGFSYKYGMAVTNWEWLNGPSILIMVFIFVPFYIRRKIATMPQFLELRYDKRIRTLFAVITILTYILINLPGVIFSGGFMLNKILGIDMYIGMWGLVLISGILVIYGGMESVAWTNLFQGILLLGGGLIVFLIGLLTVPGGWRAILGDGERAHLILPANHPDIPWPGLIVLALSTNIWFFCSNQTINQSALGAKNEWHAKAGVLLVGFLTIIIVTVDVFPGMIAYALNPNLPAPDEAYPYVIQNLVPPGLKGIIFAAVCGTIISNLEALGHASSTIFVFDIYKDHVNKNATDPQMIRIGRITALAALVFAALWAPLVMRFGQIFSYFQEGWAFIAIPVTIIFLLGIFWKGLTTTSAFLTLCLSFPLLALPYLLRLWKVQMNVYNVAGFVLVGCLLFTIITSIATRKRYQPKPEYLWTPSMLKLPGLIFPGGVKWYRRVEIWAVFLVGIYAVLYVVFW